MSAPDDREAFPDQGRGASATARAGADLGNMNRLLIGAPDKTKLLLHFLQADIERGFTLIADRTIADATANLIPAKHTERTLYLDPSDFDHPPGFNVLSAVTTTVQKDKLTQDICAYFEAMFPNGWGAQSNFLLALTLRILLDSPNETLLGVLKVLTDTSYRASLLANCNDPVVLAGWDFVDRLAADDRRWYPNAIAPLMNKIGTILMSPPMRNIIGQERTTFSLAEGYINIICLDRAALGDLTAKLLGSLFLARMQGQVYIADLGFLASDHLATQFPQNRFGVVLRFLPELRHAPKLREAVLGIPEKYVFATNAEDAEQLAFHVGVMNIRQLTELRHDEYRSVNDTHRLQEVELGRRLKAVRRRSRAAFTRPREAVERAISAYFAKKA
jgi:hypothetical protein